MTSGGGFEAFVNLEELEDRARQVLPQATYDYFAGGAETEAALRANADAFGRWRFAYRVLTGVGIPDLTTRILGETLSIPVLLSPTGMQRLAHPDGELAAARAAATAGTIYCASTLGTYPLEDVALAATGVKWFQLYVQRDRAVTKELIERAAEAEYAALVMTVDAPVIGRRERDIRNAFAMPPGITYANLRSVKTTLESQGGASGLARDAAGMFDTMISWRDLEWLVGATDLPVLVKGVVRGDDAKRAVSAGAKGIIVSNHGGRQLDYSIATLDALPAVLEAVPETEVLLDGGVRRGSDVAKAIALGAKAVMIGRPYLWGLALAGEEGVTAVLAHLRAELILAMTLLGASSIEEIVPDLLVPAHATWGGDR